MLRRRVLQVTAAIGLVVAALLGTGSAANASPGSFKALTIHANGAGAVADQAVGGITWYNRSVALTSVKFWVHAGECGSLELSGMDSAGYIKDQREYTGLCGNRTSGKWYTIGDVVLDGSDVPGGLRDVMIYVWDDTHKGSGYTTCARAAASCVIRAS
ncbi:hypothetical protein Afil01_23070 [Actinorhabdospora filicis]|uniref:Secreted protein n=1 Tax=Actinorhabdospora filicis TaxID=1785913 RepID=A0A9W6SI18_9ACTN|nr:hypothetical protein [Actinorhabdospora filicis]GLZ77500.1 hypothetical protein Afil01_23070 [Actinorhabdospora filicis]